MAQAVLPNYQCCFVFDKFETLHPDYTSTRATFRRRATIRDRGLDDPPVLACMTHEAVRPVAGTKGRYGPPLTGTRQLWHFVTLGDRERRLLATTLSVMWRRGGMESQSVTHGAAMASRLQGGQPSWAASSGVGRRKGVQPHSLSSKSGSSDMAPSKTVFDPVDDAFQKQPSVHEAEVWASPKEFVRAGLEARS